MKDTEENQALLATTTSTGQDSSLYFSRFGQYLSQTAASLTSWLAGDPLSRQAKQESNSVWCEAYSQHLGRYGSKHNALIFAERESNDLYEERLKVLKARKSM